MTRAEMDARGWDELDVLIVNGDAYVDHPAFGGALIGRFLEGRGLRVGMIAQPRWDDPEDMSRLGRPRLFVGCCRRSGPAGPAFMLPSSRREMRAISWMLDQVADLGPAPSASTEGQSRRM
jgi:hypothetical protein